MAKWKPTFCFHFQNHGAPFSSQFRRRKLCTTTVGEDLITRGGRDDDTHNVFLHYSKIRWKSAPWVCTWAPVLTANLSQDYGITVICHYCMREARRILILLQRNWTYKWKQRVLFFISRKMKSCEVGCWN